MRILITGGTGFIGDSLTGLLAERGHEVTVLTRAVRKGYVLPRGASILQGNPTLAGPWQDGVADHDVVINLAGASIFSYWSQGNRQKILDSRLLTTRNVVHALASRKAGETHLLSISGVGYYGHHGDEILDEDSPPGDDFLAQVALQWEREALIAREHNVRVVICRLGHVLGRERGMLPKLVTAHRFRIGGTWGNGQQWLSWIHKQDLMETLLFLLEHREISGPINVTAPNPVRNRDMARLMNKALNRTLFIPSIPAFILKLTLGDFAGVFLNGQRALPRKLTAHGYRFRYPSMEEAFKDLLGHP